MVQPNKKQLEKMKKQDRELAKLPSIDSEKKKFSKGESFLSKLLKKKKTIKPDRKKLGLVKTKIKTKTKAKKR